LCNSDLFLLHCFISCLKYYKIKEDIIEYAKYIILDILLVKDLIWLYKALGRVINLSYGDEKGVCHTPKIYELFIRGDE
jgi:hypothetical protein